MGHPTWPNIKVAIFAKTSRKKGRISHQARTKQAPNMAQHKSGNLRQDFAGKKVASPTRPTRNKHPTWPNIKVAIFAKTSRKKGRISHQAHTKQAPNMAQHKSGNLRQDFAEKRSHLPPGPHETSTQHGPT